MTKSRVVLIIGAVLLIGLTACYGGEAVPEPDPSPIPSGEDAVELTVLYQGATSDFNRLYGDIFVQQHPNTPLRVVDLYQYTKSPNEESILRVIEEIQPDIVELDSYIYHNLADKGKLASLEPYILSSNYDLDSFHPPVIEMLRSKQNEELYGLTPYYGGSALFMNVSILRENGIEPPSEHMTFPEFVRLMARLAPSNEDDWTTSRSYLDPYLTIRSYGVAAGLQEVDATSKQLTMDTDAWREIWVPLIEAYRNKGIVKYDQTPGVPAATMEDKLKKAVQGNGFAAGKVVFTSTWVDLLETLQMLKDSTLENKPSFEWRVVPLPQSTHSPGTILDIGLTNVFSITTYSRKPQAAWELIQYMNSEETARRNSAIKGYGKLPSRPAAVRGTYGEDVQAFYAHKKIYPADRRNQLVPQTFRIAMSEMANAEIQAAIDGRQTAEEALQRVQEQGQALLDEKWLEADDQ